MVNYCSPTNEFQKMFPATMNRRIQRPNQLQMLQQMNIQTDLFRYLYNVTDKHTAANTV